MTESTGGATGTNADEPAVHGSVGLLTANMEGKIVDVSSGKCLPPRQSGELWLRGPTIMSGYIGDDEATASTLDSEGWLRTGDLCYFDHNGHLFIEDRLKELIKYKAYQVPPAELENLLQSHPEIVDAAVVPYPHEVVGQIPMAFIVKQHRSTLTEEQVMDFVAKQVTQQDMVETFLRPFEMCVKEGDVSSVMCSYNEIDGIPACADARLMRGTIRNDWNLHRYIVSDCDSVMEAAEHQKFRGDAPEDSVAQTLRAGLDMDCGDYYHQHLESAVMKGLVKESDVDQAMINNYMVLFRTGYFDGIPLYDSLGASYVCSKGHTKLAADTAKQDIVLLKNKVFHASMSLR